MINTVDGRIREIVGTMDKVSQVSARTSEIVKLGSADIQDMGKQMNIIKSVITKSLSTVTGQGLCCSCGRGEKTCGGELGNSRFN